MGEVIGKVLDSVSIKLHEGDGGSSDVLATPVIVIDPESGVERAAIRLGPFTVAATMSGGEARTLEGDAIVKYSPPLTAIHYQGGSDSLQVFEFE